MDGPFNSHDLHLLRMMRTNLFLVTTWDDLFLNHGHFLFRFLFKFHSPDDPHHWQTLNFLAHRIALFWRMTITYQFPAPNVKKVSRILLQ